MDPRATGEDTPAPVRGPASASTRVRQWGDLGLAGALVLAVLVLAWVHASPAAFIWIAGGLTAALGGLLGRRFGFERPTAAIVGAGLLLSVAHWSYTSHAERNYDGPDQMRYILAVAHQLRLPSAGECFVCHQPPLYYVLAAPVARVSAAMFPERPVLLLQLASLWLFVAFVWQGLAIVARMVERPWALRAAAVLLAFWPLGVMRSIQVHNDALLGPLAVAALGRTLAWEAERRPRDLLLAALAAALAVATKMSGYVAAFTLGVAVVVRARGVLESPRERRAALAGLMMLVVAAGIGLHGKRAGGTFCGRLLGSACGIPVTNQLPNRVSSYLWFDLGRFLGNPWVLVEHGPNDALYFWNHFLKSSLFGTMSGVDPELGYRLNAGLALAGNGVLLGLIAFAGFGLLAWNPARRYERRTLLVFATASIVSVMGFRMAVPVPHHADFRHAFAVLIVGVAFFARALSSHLAGGHARMAGVGALLAVMLPATSLAYFVPKRVLVERIAPSWLERVTPSPRPRPSPSAAPVLPSAAPGHD